MARILFDKDFVFESEKTAYYKAVFGSDYQLVYHYLKEVESAIPLEYYQWFGEIDTIRELTEKPKLNDGKINALKVKTQMFEEDIAKSNSMPLNRKKLLYF